MVGLGRTLLQHDEWKSLLEMKIEFILENEAVKEIKTKAGKDSLESYLKAIILEEIAGPVGTDSTVAERLKPICIWGFYDSKQHSDGTWFHIYECPVLLRQPALKMNQLISACKICPRYKSVSKKKQNFKKGTQSASSTYSESYRGSQTTNYSSYEDWRDRFRKDSPSERVWKSGTRDSTEKLGTHWQGEHRSNF
jgi:hypothetical protein